MKKLILAGLIAVSSLFANGYAVGEYEGVGTLRAKSVNVNDGIVFLDYKYQGEATVTKNILEKTKNMLVNYLCQNSGIRKGLDDGFKIVVTYEYTNNKVIHFVINSCPL